MPNTDTAGNSLHPEKAFGAVQDSFQLAF